MKFGSYLASSGRKFRPLDACAFTLVELLAVIACLGILAALCIGASQAAFGAGAKVREINAARNLIAAYIATGADNNGQYMPGMDMRANASSNPVYKADGTIVSNVRAAQRYPFRLAPYLNNNFNGTILVNKNIKKIMDATGGSGPNYDYYVSGFPALGINVYCVGGVALSNGSIMFGSDCISTVAKTRGSIVAFTSAGQGQGSAKTDGYSYVSPPTLSNDSPICQAWDSAGNWKSTSDPMSYGYVDFRYDGKAVCAFLDGSIRMLAVDELRDMRLWNPVAAEQNNPDYRMSN